MKVESINQNNVPLLRKKKICMVKVKVNVKVTLSLSMSRRHIEQVKKKTAQLIPNLDTSLTTGALHHTNMLT